uniref:Senescence domain-containing protein n=1 Tax=Quercus lobata TaxID=97700 RepID=A0A7N2R727_QUELO
MPSLNRNQELLVEVLKQEWWRPWNSNQMRNSKTFIDRSKLEGKVCDAVEVAGRNVMSKSSSVTTELVSHRYGEQAGHATSEGLDAAGHAIGTGWAAFKIRKAFNPKSVLKPTTLAKTAAKAAAADRKAKISK